MKHLVNGTIVEMTDADIAEYNASLISDARILSHKWESIRTRRNNLLSQSDWVVTKALETGVAVTDAWKNYRQALRDVPSQSDVDNISWPTEPS
tara:strand:+ start:1791 stop:2072 length:282 start_codon:yes stop_codon:yes gene_type:complete